MNKLLKLKPAQLLTHPRNMRRFYPEEHVQEMANSILATKGVIEPLIVAKDSNGKKWVVIDGNMRLAGARLLGEKCPLLDCKVAAQGEAEQLLSMITANQVRYDVDAVSEAMHYKMLKDEGLSVREISKRTGVYEIRIANRLILAELEEPIQKLIMEGKLPTSHIAAKSFLKLSPTMRIKLAKRLADNPNTKISTIEKACEHLSKNQIPQKKLKRPGIELSGALKKGASDISSIRKAAKDVCQKCNQVENKLQKNREPAWSMVVHSVDEVCDCCELKDMQKICMLCPIVVLIKNLVNMGDKLK